MKCELILHTIYQVQQDEWVVCRVFKKSGGAKKFPSNQTRTVNPYSMEINPNIMPSPMMHMGDPSHFLYGRNYMSNAELAEASRVFRGGGSTSVNLPMQPHSQLNYPVTAGGGGGGCFTISGLNLNLGGGAAAATQPVLRPMPPPPAQTMTQQNVSSYMMTASSLVAENVGYGTDMGNANPSNNRYMGMDHCMDLDNYWPSY